MCTPHAKFGILCVPPAPWCHVVPPEYPILLNLLARTGVVNSNYLKKTRRYVIVIIFSVAAILTPPDPITQIGLAIPLLLLYELSIITVRFTEKKNKDKELEDA